MPKSLALIAFIDAPTRPIPKPFRAVTAEKMTAVYAPLDLRMFRTRRAVFKVAQQRQAFLEQLLPLGPVLPALHSTSLPQSQARAALISNRADLRGWADQVRGCAQYQVTIATAQGVTFDRQTPAGQSLVCQVQDLVSTKVIPSAKDHLDLPVNDTTLANLVVLVPEGAEALIEAALEQIDALWSEGLHIKLIGPSPAVSFASIGLRSISAGAVAEAAELLQIDLSAPHVDPSTALKAALRANGGLRDPAPLRAAARLCQKAMRRKTASDPVWDAFLWSEGRASQTLPIEKEVA